MECGLPIGDVATLFRSMRAQLVEKVLAERGTVPSCAAVDSKLQIPVGAILDQLGVKHLCCRMHLVSASVLSDVNR